MTEKKDEILLADKPVGITSFDVIRILRKKLKIKKIGHAGTLDPLASGLMILGINKGTKLLTKYTKLDKKYIAKICIGEKSETGDREGKIISKKTVKNIDTEKIEKALKEIIGINNLPVPIYSAIKKKGEPLYKKARRGEKVKPPIKKMIVYEAKLLKTESENNMFFITVELKVNSGTYIRSIAEALGNKLGYPARLESLRRTQVGKFNVSNAEKINAVEIKRRVTI